MNPALVGFISYILSCMNGLEHTLQTHHFPSGSAVLNIIAPEIPFSVVSVWCRAGSRFDKPDKAGTAHLLEHLLSRNKHFPSQSTYLQDLESRGIFSNAFTGKEVAYYYHYQAAEEAAYSLKRLLETTQELSFTEQNLEDERRIILNESRRNKESPEDFLWELSNEGLWGRSPLGQSFFGTEETLRLITASDLKSFYESRYRNVAQHIVTINYPNWDELIQKTQSFSAQQTASSENRPLILKEPAQDKLQDQGGDHVQIALNTRTVPFTSSEERHALDLLARVLGGSWISRGNQKLRLEHAFTYWVDSFTEYFSDQGLLRVSYSVTRENVAQSLELLHEVVRLLQEKPLEEKEFEAHRASYVGHLLRMFTDPQEILWHYGYPTALGQSPVTLLEEIAALRQLKSSDVHGVAQKYLVKDGMSLVEIS